MGETTRDTIILDLTASDLGRIRFAVSPINQLIGALTVLTGRALPPGIQEWRQARLGSLKGLLTTDQLLGSFVELLAVTRYVPDCVSTPPRTNLSGIDDELATLRGTPADRIRADLRRSERIRRPGWTPRAGSWDDSDLPARLADSLAKAWDVLLAHDWPTIRALLERDIAYRAGIVATHGLAAAFDDLGDELQWRASGELAISGRDQTRHVLAGAGLWLLPNAFGGGWLCLDPPDGYALTYPARGTADLMAPSAAPPSHIALERLVGRSRAALLRRLDQPASTSQLSADLRMTIGAVGDHLAVLRANRLVTRSRAGRSVLYRRTQKGNTLVDAEETPTH